MICLLALLACRPDATSADPASPPPLDLTEVLGPGQVRAGEVVDGQALFGGTSAEGQVGDVKIYNSRVQFVVQAVMLEALMV